MKGADLRLLMDMDQPPGTQQRKRGRRCKLRHLVTQGVVTVLAVLVAAALWDPMLWARDHLPRSLRCPARGLPATSLLQLPQTGGEGADASWGSEFTQVAFVVTCKGSQDGLRWREAWRKVMKPELKRLRMDLYFSVDNAAGLSDLWSEREQHDDLILSACPRPERAKELRWYQCRTLHAVKSALRHRAHYSWIVLAHADQFWCLALLRQELDHMQKAGMKRPVHWAHYPVRSDSDSKPTSSANAAVFSRAAAELHASMTTQPLQHPTVFKKGDSYLDLVDENSTTWVRQDTRFNNRGGDESDATVDWRQGHVAFASLTEADKDCFCTTQLSLRIPPHATRAESVLQDMMVRAQALVSVPPRLLVEYVHEDSV